MNTRLTLVLGLAAACGAVAPATAQRIEISSESLGTVVVTPRPIAGTAPAQVRIPAQSGIDLGLRRNPDGSLRDPFAQPAGSASAVNDRARAGANPRTRVAATATGSVDRVNGQATYDAGTAANAEPGGLPPGGRYGNATNAQNGSSGTFGAGSGDAMASSPGAVPAGATGFAR